MQGDEGYDWSAFDVHMPVAADAPRVYDRWATASGMESFFVRRLTYLDPDGASRATSEQASSGDSYELEFDHPFTLRGRVLLAEPTRRFAFSFGAMRVEVTLEPDRRGTLIRLVQSGIPTDGSGRAESHLNCRSCWVYYLLNLRSVIEHDRDLRDGGLPDNPASIHFGTLRERV